jgi:hypothetical protein
MVVNGRGSSLFLSLHVHFQFRKQEQEFGQENESSPAWGGAHQGDLSQACPSGSRTRTQPALPCPPSCKQIPANPMGLVAFLCFFAEVKALKGIEIGVPLTANSDFRSTPLAWNMAKALVLGAIVLVLVECATCGAGRMTASGGLPRVSSSGGLKGVLRRPMRLKGGGEGEGESGGAPNVPAASNDDDGRDTTVVTQTFIRNKVGLKTSRDAPPPSRSRCADSCQSQLKPPMGFGVFGHRLYPTVMVRCTGPGRGHRILRRTRSAMQPPPCTAEATRCSEPFVQLASMML